MRHGTIDVFFSGLETLLGPPLMLKDPEMDDTPTIRMSIENEHTNMPDSNVLFHSPNGTTTTASTEWDFCYHASKAQSEYPERKGFREEHPEWCRKPGIRTHRCPCTHADARARFSISSTQMC